MRRKRRSDNVRANSRGIGLTRNKSDARDSFIRVVRETEISLNRRRSANSSASRTTKPSSVGPYFGPIEPSLLLSASSADLIGSFAEEGEGQSEQSEDGGPVRDCEMGEW